MLNLLGCNKDNFLKLIKIMNYKTFEKNNEFYFKYVPSKRNTKKLERKNESINNPFGILKTMDIK